MKLLGLIGYPLEHSFSANYFQTKFLNNNIKGFDYKLFPLADIDEFPAFLSNNPDLIGFNVTIPYKEKIIPFLTEIDDNAAKIGSVNVVKIIEYKNTKILKGYNTDIIGFEATLEHLIFFNKHQKYKALILGNGGASKSVKFVLKKLNIPIQIVSRKTEKNCILYNQLNKDIMEDFQMIINTTPLGMFPEINSCPDIPYEYINTEHILIDLVYNPSLSLFLKEGKKRGAKTANGLLMLEKQAEAAWSIWNE